MIVTGYKIVSVNQPSQLASRVQALVEEGWQPHGSMTAVTIHTQNRFSGVQHLQSIHTVEYAQALIK